MGKDFNDLLDEFETNAEDAAMLLISTSPFTLPQLSEFSEEEIIEIATLVEKLQKEIDENKKIETILKYPLAALKIITKLGII